MLLPSHSLASSQCTLYIWRILSRVFFAFNYALSSRLDASRTWLDGTTAIQVILNPISPRVVSAATLIFLYYYSPFAFIDYGCWLSGIDCQTQLTCQQIYDPWLAIVVDPTRTVSAGKVELGAFRCYPKVFFFFVLVMLALLLFVENAVYFIS